MTKKSEAKIYGTVIDRNMKTIRSNYLKVFKEIGVDITTEQWVLMDCLYEKDGLSQKQLAADSFKNAPTVSRIIDLLCKKELAERLRFENDRRRYKIFLTEKGKKIYQKTYPHVEKLRTKGWNGLSDRDYSSFLRIMNQIYSNFEK